MEDLGNYKIIIYIILAILYFLFTGKKKPKSAGPAQNKPPFEQEEIRPHTPPKTVVSQPKPLLSRPSKPVALPKEQEPLKPQPISLDDLLREFGKGLEGTIEERQQEQEVVKEVSQEVLSPKVVDYDEEILNENILADQKIKNDLAKKYTVEPIVFGKDDHFTPYTIEKDKANKYAEMLKDPEGVKMAFIAGEIFNRKY